MNHLEKLKHILIMVLLGAVAIRVILWSIEPLLPLVIGILVFVAVYSVLFRRKL